MRATIDGEQEQDARVGPKSDLRAPIPRRPSLPIPRPRYRSSEEGGEPSLNQYALTIVSLNPCLRSSSSFFLKSSYPQPYI